jgi:hypothetical protein
MNKKHVLATSALALVVALGISGSASATSVAANIGVTANGNGGNASAQVRATGDGANLGILPGDNKRPEGMGMNNGIFGKVTAVNGSTITVTSLNRDKNATTQTSTIYVVNASGATVDKNTSASTIASVVVGDSIFVEGKVDGTNVTATKIHDGVMAKGGQGDIHGNGSVGANIPDGNGQPIIGGTVTAVNGNTITITNKSNVSYTIDATSAKVTKSGTTAVVSNISVGDTLVAQGTVNGTSVSAVNIVDSGATASATASGSVQSHGFFGMIGSFFSKLFGFGK